MNEILVAKYGFQASTVHILRDSMATHDAILQSIRTTLLEPAANGDVCVFMFSGYGSQVTNSGATDADRLENTIVPADAACGAPDIRDKDLRVVFNDIIDRGATLSVFFDCGHAMALDRGVFGGQRTRSAPMAPRDIVKLEPRDLRFAPETRGALIIAGACGSQPANEGPDVQGVVHGRFTSALLRTLRAVPATAPSAQVLTRVRAFMLAQGDDQAPDMTASADRRVGGLFGTAGNLLPDALQITLMSVSGSGECSFNGGAAVGIRPGCELSRRTNDTAREYTLSPRVRVTSIGPTRCYGQIISGLADSLREGDAYDVTSWTAENPMLRIWLPPALDISATRAFVRSLVAAVSRTDRVAWVADPTAVAPTHAILWNGFEWELRQHAGDAVRLGPSPNPARLLADIVASSRDSLRLYLNLPPSPELSQSLQAATEASASPVRRSLNVDSAQYVLAGCWDGAVRYCWTLSDALRFDSPRGTAMPARTDWWSYTSIPGSLQRAALPLWGQALTLARLQSWLDLESPPDDATYPYDLEVESARTNRPLTEPVVTEGDTLRIALRRLDSGRRNMPSRRHVYLLAIDGYGRSRVLFPRARLQEDNVLPKKNEQPERIVLCSVRVVPPFGPDTYVLVTSSEPLDDLAGFESPGVRTRSGEPLIPRGVEDIRTPLLTMSASGSGRWSVRRLYTRSVPRLITLPTTAR